MKFRDPKTGEVFENIRTAIERRTCDATDCRACPISSFNNEEDLTCVRYANKYPTEAAHWIGYEVVEDESAAGETPNGKPPICKILGGKDNPLEIGEVFTIKGYPNREYRYAVIHTDGKLHNYLEEPCQTTGTRVGNKIGVNTLYWLFDHPEAIIRKPRFTQEEVAQAEDIRRVFGREDVIKRTDEGVLCYGHITLNGALLPSLRPGQSISLADLCTS